MIAPTMEPRDPTTPALARTLHNDETEQAILSAMLWDNGAIVQAQALLSVDDFHRTANGLVFRAICAVHDDGQKVDPITVAARLEFDDTLRRAGGKEYIGELIDVVPSGENVGAYASVVREYAGRRRLLAVMRDAGTRLTEGADSRELAQRLFTELLPFTVDGTGAGYRHVRDLLWPLMEDIEARAGGGARGLMTGYAAIDTETNGFRPGELVIVAGAEKLGKSAIALNIVRRVLRQDVPVGVAYVSAEMTAPSVVERLLSQLTRIEATRLQSGKLVDDDFPQLARWAGELSNVPLWIDDEAEPTLADVVARATNLKAQHPDVGLIVVDFMQLIQSPEKNQTEARELKKIAYGLKGLAKRLDVVVLAPCQVNTKEVEDQKDMRPRLKDLQGSSGMRQAADFIALAYREGLYNEMAADADVLELNFAACRRTRRFTVRLRWDGPTMTING